MPPSLSRLLRMSVVAGALVAMVVAAANHHRLRTWLDSVFRPSLTPVQSSQNPDAMTVNSESVQVAADVARKFGIRTTAVKRATEAESLKLNGSLILNANRMSRVHTRFAGEVVEISLKQPDGEPLGFGDTVSRGQLLAVIWSRELGEKKSELIDAMSRLLLEQENLKSLEKLLAQGATSERLVREAERVVESDRVAISRVVRTLRTWRVAETEIAAVQAEAERLHRERGKNADGLAKDWARVEIRSPLDGVIMEKNIAVGDLVNTDLDLFEVADLSLLRVMAYAYEDDLPVIDALSETARNWSVRLRTDRDGRPHRGVFDQIGRIIDPVQHTALVMGTVENPEGRLRVGQFVTATIDLPCAPDQVVVPASAVLDDGHQTTVFVQPDPEQFRYERRRVSVARRDDQTVFISNRPGRPGASSPVAPLQESELVVSTGAAELAQALKGK